MSRTVRNAVLAAGLIIGLGACTTSETAPLEKQMSAAPIEWQNPDKLPAPIIDQNISDEMALRSYCANYAKEDRSMDIKCPQTAINNNRY